MKALLVVTMALLCSTVVLATGGDGEFNNEYLSEIMKNGDKTNEMMPKLEESGKAFYCQRVPITWPRPTSVHNLRPGDIEVFGAIGDSLSAANGAQASTILGLITEYRGVSYCCGTQEADLNKHFTLAGALKFYNPNIQGTSYGSGKFDSIQSGNNVAQPGHTAVEIYPQAVALVNRIKGSGGTTKWKFINLFIGGNDLCKFCDDRNKYSVTNWVNNIRNTLDYLMTNLENAFVSVMVTLDVTGINVLTGSTCRNMQSTLCKCGLDAGAPEIAALAKIYQQETYNLINSGRYDTRDDFTVVLQEFMKDMTPPMLTNGKPDYTLFAPDCFHFSQKGHQAAGIELWNSVLTPVGRKPTLWKIGQDPVCITNSSILYTNKNSKIATLKKLLVIN